MTPAALLQRVADASLRAVLVVALMLFIGLNLLSGKGDE